MLQINMTLNPNGRGDFNMENLFLLRSQLPNLRTLYVMNTAISAASLAHLKASCDTLCRDLMERAIRLWNDRHRADHMSILNCAPLTHKLTQL